MESFVAGKGLGVCARFVGYGAVVAHGRPSAAQEARAIAASTNTGTLATISEAGDPWASFVTFGLLDGAPVLCVSDLAEHGRNLLADQRASMVIVAPDPQSPPLAWGRITLAGVVEQPTGDELAAGRAAFLADVPSAEQYLDFSDFTLWVLRVARVRWFGEPGRMASVTGEEYLAASIGSAP
jgi:heme oxygenase (biliverdin-IX-beta and delta-forming)